MKIVAVTACIAGLAHTYMAKSNLEKFSEQYGHKIKVESQGAMGLENKITQEEVNEADVVIFAVDTNVTERDRFSGKKVLEVTTQDAIRDGENVIKKAENLI